MCRRNGERASCEVSSCVVVMRTATVAVVAGLVVLASALAGGALAADRHGASAGGHGASTGAAASLQAENDSNASALPPGVNASGVENASALVAAHRRGLAATGYRYVLVQNASFEESPFDGFGLPVGDFTADSVERGAVEAGLAPFHVRSTGRTTVAGRESNVSAELWGNETVLVVRTRFATRVDTQRVNVTRDGAGAVALARDDVNDTVTRAEVVRATLASGPFEVVNATGSDGLVTLRATEFDGNRSLGFDAENVTRYDARVVVDRQGVVHRLSLVVATGDEHLRYAFEVAERGPVDVTRPAWVETALRPGCGCAPTPNRSGANTTAENTTTGNASAGLYGCGSATVGTAG